ncbi:hypothetical protein Btru_010388 [Bulinus truncatus]|nr:hypothetical protein Btru_010388 [Bulinus truncatus]
MCGTLAVLDVTPLSDFCFQFVYVVGTRMNSDDMYADMYEYYYHETNYSLEELNELFMKPTVKNEPTYEDYVEFCGVQGHINHVMLLKAHMCFIMPPLAVIGIFLNIICAKVLRRDGLDKPSNVFLFALVLADIINILRFMNYGDLVYRFGPGNCHYTYELNVNVFLFSSDRFFTFLDGMGRSVNATVPMVITVERFLAVYFPMTFKLVVTKKSAIIVCLCIYVFWLPWALMVASFQQLSTDNFNDELGVIVAFGGNSDEIIFYFQQAVLGMFLAWIPNIFVCIGCVFVAVKVKVSLRNRSKISARNKQIKWSPRTTRTLLSTCIVFVITHTISASIYHSLLGIMQMSQVTVMTMYTVNMAEFFNFLNCVSNFFIYIASNRNLFLHVKQIFQRK